MREKKPDYKLNATAASLLGFLHEQPMTGWDLVQAAEMRIGNFWSLTRSQVYRELLRLDEAGLIKAGKKGVRDRKPFTLTNEGRAAFKNWIMQEPGPEIIRFPLLLYATFAQHIPREQLIAFLETQESIHAKRLNYYQELNSRLKKQPAAADGLLTLSFGIAYEKMVLAWIQETKKEKQRQKDGPI